MCIAIASQVTVQVNDHLEGNNMLVELLPANNTTDLLSQWRSQSTTRHAKVSAVALSAVEFRRCDILAGWARCQGSGNANP